MSAPEYVAQAAELLTEHGLDVRLPSGDEVCLCGACVADQATHQAEVLAAAGLIPTSTEWGVLGQGAQVYSTLSGRRMDEEDARDVAGGVGTVVSRAVTDWKDATDD